MTKNLSQVNWGASCMVPPYPGGDPKLIINKKVDLTVYTTYASHERFVLNPLKRRGQVDSFDGLLSTINIILISMFLST